MRTVSEVSHAAIGEAQRHSAAEGLAAPSALRRRSRRLDGQRRMHQRAHPCQNHFDARIWLQAGNDRLRREASLNNEEIRIKDARMESVPARRPPHYPPIERLAILELCAARGWSQAQTARRLLVTPLTIASWTRRLDDEGPDATFCPHRATLLTEVTRINKGCACPSLSGRDDSQELRPSHVTPF